MTLNKTKRRNKKSVGQELVPKRLVMELLGELVQVPDYRTFLRIDEQLF